MRHVQAYGANTAKLLIEYNTLTDTYVLARTAGAPVDLNKFRQGTSGLFTIADQLAARVDAKLGAFSLHGNIPLTFGMCKILCNSGLVAKLILLPRKTLRDVQRWAKSDDTLNL